MVNARLFDPDDFGWRWDVTPSDIVEENNFGTFFNLHINGRTVRNIIAVFIDGATSFNGYSYAKAASAVCFGSNSRMNLTVTLPSDEPRTSQRAELTAAIEAVKRIAQCHRQYPSIGTYVVISDSQYVVSGITNWIEKWRGNGYLNAAGNPLANVDLWQELDSSLWRSNERILFWKVDREENEEADRMAKMGVEWQQESDSESESDW